MELTVDNQAELDQYLNKIKILTDYKQYDEALSLCEDLIAEHPKGWFGYREKAHVLDMKREGAESLACRRKVAELGSDEPGDYYHLAITCQSLGEYQECVSWADYGIMLCEQHNHYYYHPSCVFFKANALLALQRYEDALAQALTLDDGFKTWVNGKGIITKEDIIKSAEYALGQRKQKVWKFDDDS